MIPVIPYSDITGWGVHLGYIRLWLHELHVISASPLYAYRETRKLRMGSQHTQNKQPDPLTLNPT